MGEGRRLRIIGLMDADSQRSDLIRALVRRSGGTVSRDVGDFIRSVGQDAPDCLALGPFDPRGGASARLVGRLRRDHPHVGIVVVCDTTPAAIKQLPHLTRAGADEVVLTSMGSLDEAAAMVEQICARRREASVWHRLAPRLPQACQEVVQLCFANALHRRSVGELARHLRIDRSTLAARLRSAGLPTAHTILSWSRLIGVVELMESSRMSVEQAALTAGFGSASALRAFTRRLVGVAPRTLAERGARSVEEKFLALLKQR